MCGLVGIRVRKISSVQVEGLQHFRPLSNVLDTFKKENDV